MLSKPHMAFGCFTGAVVMSGFQAADVDFVLNAANILIGVSASVAGSVAVDLDAPHSPAARVLPFLANPIQRRWPHRTLLHSLLGAVICSAILYYAIDFIFLFLPLPDRIPFMACMYFFGAHLGHLVVDSLTVTGVPWLWPFQRAFAYPTPRKYRVTTGDKKEKYYALFFLFLFLLYLPVLKAGGTSKAIHKTFKNFEMASDDYLKAADIETWLTFKGSYRHDRVSVSGKSLILDAKENFFVIYYDGKILTIGEQALILGTEFICEYTDAVPQIFELSVVSQPIDSVLAKVPDNVLMSGELVSAKQFQANVPVFTANDFPTLKVMSGRIEFEYAGKREMSLLNVRIPEDIRKLQAFVRSLEKDIENTGTEIDSLARKRSGEKQLLVRYNLQEQIEELRSKRTSLEKSLEGKKRQLEEFGTSDIEFSGKLNLRKLPSPAEKRQP